MFTDVTDVLCYFICGVPVEALNTVLNIFAWNSWDVEILRTRNKLCFVMRGHLTQWGELRIVYVQDEGDESEKAIC